MSHAAVGLVVADRYRLVAQVGSGPSAVVYLADDVRLRRRVAVKMLHATLGAESDVRDRFGAQMQSVARLRHPHIGAVHDWGFDPGPFVVGDYFDHGSLRDLLDRGVVLDPSQVMQVALAGARALEYAHGRGVLHRGVRPENLLFGVDGRVEVADFGLARIRAEAASTRPLDLAGSTSVHIAPEQARGGTVDGRADVFSLVTVLVEAATGRPPLADDPAHARGRPPPVPSFLGPVRDVLVRASTVDPAQRLDAAELVTALMAVAEAYPDPHPLPLRESGPAPTPEPPVADDITIVGAPGTLLAPDTVEATVPAPSTDRSEVPGSVANPEAVAVPVDPGPAPPHPETSREAPDTGTGGRDEPRTDAAGAWARTGRRVAWIVLALVVLVGGAVVTTLVIQAQRTPTHLIPDIDGLTVGEAEARLGALGFEVHTEQVRRDGTVADELVDIDPVSGTRLAEGERVTLTVSEGPPLVTVPDDTAGRAPGEVTDRLGELGLVVEGPVERHSEDIAEGAVIGTEPGGGEELEKGSTVTLVVSAGPEPRVVPTTDGMDPSELEAALQQMGLIPEVTERYDTEVDRGGLIGMDPAPGTTVARGTTVELVVSKGLLVAVPDLDGVDSVSGAIRRLEEAGLTADELLGSGSLSGRPAAFDPPAGDLVVKGSAVDIVVR